MDANITIFSPQNASPKEWAKFTALMRQRNDITNPNDTRLTAQFVQNNFSNIPENWSFTLWVAQSPSQRNYLGYAYLIIDHGAQDNLPVEFDLFVEAKTGKQSIINQLIACVFRQAQQEGKSFLTISLDTRFQQEITALLKRGAKIGSVHQGYQLDHDKMEWNTIEKLQRNGERLQDFDLLFWEGAYPDDHIHAFCDLYNRFCVWCPKDDLESIHDLWTVERLQAQEKAYLKTGQRWTIVVYRKSDKQLVGFTESIWEEGLPKLLFQGDTGVDPSLRRQGLGGWIKAEMLVWVLSKHPEIESIRTNNARSNKAVIALNQKMGYRLIKERAVIEIRI